MANWWDKYEGKQEAVTPSPVASAATTGENWWDKYTTNTSPEDTTSSDWWSKYEKPTKAINFQNYGDKDFEHTLKDIADFYRMRDNVEFDDPNKLWDYFVNDRVNVDSILYKGIGGQQGVLGELQDVQGYTPEQKRLTATVQKTWADLPTFGEGSRSFMQSVPQYVAGSLLDPASYIGGGIGGFVGGKAAKYGLSRGAQAALGMGTQAATDAAVSGGANLAQQQGQIETGVRDNLDYGEAGIAAGIGGATSVLPGAVGYTLTKPKPGIADTRSAVSQAYDYNFGDNTNPLTRAGIVMKDAIRGVLQNTGDDLRAIKTLERGLDGVNPDIAGRLYRDARLTRNTSQIIEHFFETGGVQFERGQQAAGSAANYGSLKMANTPSLRSVLTEAQDNTPGGVSGFLSWVAANRRLAQRQGERVRLRAAGTTDPVKIEAEVNAKFPASRNNPSDDTMLMQVAADGRQAYSGIFDKYVEYNKGVLEFARQAGVISDESYNNLLSANNGYYVPFYKFTDDFGREVPAGKSGVVTARGLIATEGSSDDITDLIDNVVRNNATIINMSVNNAAMRQIFSRLDEASAAGSPLAKSVAERAKYTDTGRNIVTVLENGKPVRYRVKDRLLWDSVNALGTKAVDDFEAAIPLASTSKKLLTGIVTRDPSYVVANALRDTFSRAFLTQAKGTIPTPVIDSMTATAARFLDNKEYKEFVLNGGGFSSVRAAESHIRKSFGDPTRYYAQYGIPVKTVLDTPAKIADAMTKSIEAYDTVASGFENAGRFAEYRAMRQQGKSERDAAFAARNVSTDFSMQGGGDIMRQMAAMVPFFNAGVQSSYGLGRKIKREPLTAAKILIGMGGPALMLKELNQEYDIVDRQERWVKDGHFLIPYNQETGQMWPGNERADAVYKIPRAYDLAIGAVLPEILWDYTYGKESIKGDEAQSLRLVVDFIRNTMLLDPTKVQLFTPIMEVAQNKNWSGQPIVTEGIEPAEQYGPGTSKALIDAIHSSGLNISPAQAEHIIKGYTDALGSAALFAADSLLYGESERGPSPRTDQLPIIRRFISYAPEAANQDTADFYTLLSNLQVKGNTLDAIKRNRPYDVEAYMKADPELGKLIATNKYLAKLSGKLSAEMRAQRILTMKPMPAESKREALEQSRINVQAVISELMPELRKDETLRDYMVPGGSGYVQRALRDLMKKEDNGTENE